MKKITLCIVMALLGLTAIEGQSPPAADTIRIGVLKNGSYEIVAVPIETYVARVLTGEALPGSQPAALETLAIAIRTYTLENLGRHRTDGFDLCDQTHCQVMRMSTPATERAAQATAGQVLLYQGQLATVYYSASCGGRTEKPSHVWPGSEDPPYLPSRSDDGCEGFPQWSTELNGADLQRALRAAGFTGALKNVRVGERNESGRAQRILLDGMTPGEISGNDLRAAIGRTLGWQYLQSASFQLKRSGDTFRFTGHGNGHGVGLCVIGSAKLAENGESARQILARYFPGTTIGVTTRRVTAAPPLTAPPPPAPSSAAPSLAAPPSASTAPLSPARPAAAAPAAPAASATDIVISLPETEAGEQSSIAGLVRRERDTMATALGVAAPPRLAIRFQPTTEAFERSAGLPWFTLGATSATGELQFIPLSVLRDRGVLERTIRRQLVRMLTDAALQDRPAWVREGVAMHFSEGGDGPLDRVVCPQDAELTRPLSVGALSDASRRARACFERQLASRKDWRAVR